MGSSCFSNALTNSAGNSTNHQWHILKLWKQRVIMVRINWKGWQLLWTQFRENFKSYDWGYYTVLWPHSCHPSILRILKQSQYFRSWLNQTVGKIHVSFHRSYHGFDILWNLLGLHSHRRAELRATCSFLWGSWFEYSRLHRCPSNPDSFALLDSTFEETGQSFRAFQLFDFGRFDHHFLLLLHGHAACFRPPTSHITHESSLVLRNRNFCDGSDRGRDPAGKQDEKPTGNDGNFWCFEHWNDFRDFALRISWVHWIFTLRQWHSRIDHTQPSHQRETRANRETSDRFGSFSLDRTSVLRFAGNYLESYREQDRKASIFLELFVKNNVDICCDLASRGRTNNWTVRWTSRSFLLLNRWLACSSLLGSLNKLGRRFWQVELDYLEEHHLLYLRLRRFNHGNKKLDRGNHKILLNVHNIFINEIKFKISTKLNTKNFYCFGDFQDYKKLEKVRHLTWLRLQDVNESGGDFVNTMNDLT